ncbi:MAG: DUF6074 family protein [Rhizobiaceae bacterium]|nr:DUF6074 family protein [Rhizobiaceae bacterium]
MQFELDFDRTAEVIAFPADRQRARLREEAEWIRRKPRAKWNAAFNRACNRIYAETMMAGFPYDEAVRQRRAFAVALKSEIRRQIVIEALHQERQA